MESGQQLHCFGLAKTHHVHGQVEHIQFKLSPYTLIGPILLDSESIVHIFNKHLLSGMWTHPEGKQVTL